MEQWQGTALAIGTVAFVWATWRVSLRRRRYHGIFRLFSFESILVLVVVNGPVWFDHPFAVRQILSWLLLGISAWLAAHGFYLLKVVGQPKMDIEDTTVLITTGPFRYIRHPLYCSLLCGGIGAMLKSVTPLTLCLMGVNTLALIGTAKVEEYEMLERFGAVYRKYMKSTARFVPHLF